MLRFAAAALLAGTAMPVLAQSGPSPAEGSGVDPAQSQDRAGDIVITGRSEGTDDYGVEASDSAARLALSQRDTPQSISVVTRAQIEQFQLNDLNSVLRSVTGINVQQLETDRTGFTARGFEVVNFQFDGIGLPTAFGLQSGVFDTVGYDRIEVLRGANGLTSLSGNPSATINFIRKRPFETFRANGSLQYGSFDTLRGEADVSVPLTSGVSARFVAAYQNNDSHLDRTEQERIVLYGIVSADLGPATRLSAGAQWSRSDTDSPLWGALPIYFSDGTQTNYRRSTSTSADWSYWLVRDRQLFADVTHDFGNGWTAKLSVLDRRISDDQEIFYVFGQQDRVTGDGLFAYAGSYGGPTQEFVVDGHVTGRFEAFGRDHELVFGVNHGRSRFRQSQALDPNFPPLPGNSAFDGSYPRPVFAPRTLEADATFKRTGGYGMVRLNPADPLHVMLGGSLVRATSEGESYGTSRAFERERFLPFAAATYDLSTNLSVYASYTSIFNPQFEINEQRELLSPVNGQNIEAGLKGSWYDGALYASATVFRVRQDNLANFLRQEGPLVIAEEIDARSEGIEFDLGGQLLPGLQATGGATFLRIRDDGGDARTFVPRRMARISLSYTPPALPALSFGSAVQYQSRIFREDELARPAPLPPIQARAVQDDFALVDVFARYAFTPAVFGAVNLRNVTNVKNLNTFTFSQSFYGPPRAITGTIGVRF